ncbi:hypothetical protein AAVH_30220 [Aphelenchoides avenae]|nr:hypothetical protein AAVH_30220 [Aphelenchus avenae]
MRLPPRAAIFLHFLFKCALSADILFLFFHDTGSHQSSGSKYFVSLAQAGHSVTVLDTSYQTPKVYHPNVHTVSAYMPQLDSPRQAANAIWHRTVHAWHKTFSFRKGEENFESLLAMHSDKLAKLANHKWDLVVVDDLYNQPAYAFVVWRKRLVTGSKYAVLRTSFRYMPTDVHYTLG